MQRPKLLPGLSTRLVALAAVSLAAPLAAQTGTSGPAVYRRGVLGFDLEIEFTGPAFGTGIWLIAANPGPTLLPCVSPGLPLGLEPNVGSAFVFSGLAFDASGTFVWNTPLPAVLALAGFYLYAQSLSLTPFAPCPITGISNPLRFSLLPPAEAVLTIGSMTVPRTAHAFDELPDGRALLSGGENPDPSNPFPLASLEIYDPLREEFQLIGLALPEPRTRHSTVALQDGRILISGGVGAGGEVLSSSLVFDANGGGLQQLPDMLVPRAHHKLTVLEDGRVVATGGVSGGPGSTYELKNDFGFPDAFPATVQGIDTLSPLPAELFDPVSSTWTPVQAPLLPRYGHAATRLMNGTVLITGGLVFDGASSKLIETPIATVWDPSTGAVSSQVVPELAHSFHAQISTAAGGAIIAGGGRVDYTDTTFKLTRSNFPTVVFDAPPAGTIALGAPGFGPSPDPAPLITLLCVPPGAANPRYIVVTCPDPRELPPAVTGGTGGSRAVYVFDSLALTWTPVSELVYERPAHSALYFDAVERAVVTGSAWPTPAGTVGFDRTAEVLTLD